ncbi:hypothetical protein Sa4125_19360 [Aureimonas sp. SA4125]|uniref:class I SAM-dependent methyltransferase n=1 Tax=Aureimonas sp. SA4125 TaxID=2826993 RepID=UPI001CC63810|nr:class I SAM-dependent methyltransferase [Aureimonas sp. SA4125]BDA84394.1 hypothetical protein Sa4125_19360 [Aureimonas sp. SA4125]
MQDILDAYAAATTPAFIAAYESLSTETIYKNVIDLFPAHVSRIVDVGAGTGRDAAWFAERGHSVLAIEPVSGLRDAGRQLHRSADISWLDDRFPDLAKARLEDPFDLVLLGGVWQHIADEDRKTAMRSIAAMTRPGGRLIMSLRHGPGAGARRVIAIDPESTVSDANACGLRVLRRCETGSIQPGNQALGVRWTWLALQMDG